MEKLNIRLFKPSINKAELNAVKKVFDKSWLGLGGEVKKFENEFCKFVNSVIFLHTGISISFKQAI